MPYLLIVKNSRSCRDFIKKFEENENHSVIIVPAKHDQKGDPYIKRCFVFAENTNLTPVLIGSDECIPMATDGMLMTPHSALILLEHPELPITDIVSTTHNMLSRCGIHKA